MPPTMNGTPRWRNNARRRQSVPFHAEFGRVVSTIRSDRLKTALCLAWLILRPALWTALAAALIASSRSCAIRSNPVPVAPQAGHPAGLSFDRNAIQTSSTSTSLQ